jgi:biopolymer transport protein ExbD
MSARGAQPKLENGESKIVWPPRMSRLRIGLVALVAVAAVSVARAGFELTGYLKAHNVTRFVVVDLETGEQSPWLFVGDRFHDFMVMRFDANEEVLTMEQGNTVVRLPLGSRVKAEVQLTIRPDGTITMDGQPTTVEAVETVLKDFSASGRSVSFVVRSQPGQESFDAINKITNMLRDSGTKKWSLRLTDVTAERKSK